MILVISYPDEDHTVAVLRRLSERHQRFVLVDLASLPAQARLSAEWSPSGPSGFQYCSAAGTFDLADAKVGWWRRIRPHVLSCELTDPRWQAFALSETSQAVNGVLDSLPCVWINPRKADEIAHRKPYQLTVARRLGMAIPETLVTNDPDRARTFIEGLPPRQVVCKAFVAMLESWRETRLVTPDDLHRVEGVKYAPLIFQEFVEGVDLRIIVVGQRIFTVQIDARQTRYPIDMRMVIGESTTSAVELPKRVVDQIHNLMEVLGLQYGAIDMKLTDSGEYLFLEVNPAGQWLFVERLTGLPITAAMADLLIEHNA